MVKPRKRMRADAKTRVRSRIRSRLDELGMTGRELARAVNRSDAWISSLLSGAQGLAWEDLDAVAETLGLSPSELVRHDDSDLRELTPSEMRLLRHYQQWPQQIQERWLRVLDYFAASMPDVESANLVEFYRGLKAPDRRRARWLLERQFQDTPPSTDEPGGDPHASSAESAARYTTRPDRTDQTRDASQAENADDRDDASGGEKA